MPARPTLCLARATSCSARAASGAASARPRQAGVVARTAAALLALTAFACAEERDPIDRTQPNSLRKEWFAGPTFYYQRTVVDVPAANGFTFVGSTDHGGLTKIKFDVQERFLYVRRQTELVKNADDKAATGAGYEGEVVAAFPILSHFDIRHSYNPVTGEEQNILEENAFDRPWHQREFMRVDWATNLVHNYQLDFETESIELVPYFVQQTQADGTPHPDAPLLVLDGKERAEDGKRLDYFDITSRIFAKAGTTEYPGHGTIPLCWLLGEETSECGAGEYSIRHSFWQLDPGRQYEPRPFKGEETDLFGFFTVDRNVYDSKLGLKQQGKERFLARHNLWQRWRRDDGSLLPAAERPVRPIVYHVNREFPADLLPVAQKVADQWNGIFKDAVAATGNPFSGDAFILCPHNPVAKGDPAACGPAGTAPRIGDIRYSFMAYVPKYMKYGLLGLGPSNKDAETGEILSGMAYVYHHNNTAAWDTVEQIKLLNGELSPTAFIDGLDLTDWIEVVSGGSSPKAEQARRALAGAPGNHGSRFEFRGLDEATTMISRLADNDFSQFWEGRRTPISDADVAFQAEHGGWAWAEQKLQTMYDLGHLSGIGDSPAARLATMAGSQAEAAIIEHPELKLAAGAHPASLASASAGAAAPTGAAHGGASDAHHHAISPAHGGLAKGALDRSRLHLELAHARNLYLPERLDDALMGLARELKGKSSDEAWQIVRESVYTAVLAHEVGHSLGLMHNFGGSDDVVNYHNTYWELRDDGKVGPRLTDPITEAEINGKIYNYAYSSIMDYAGRLTIDGLGVGKYDRAAILFGSADKVEVFLDAGKTPTIWKQWFDGRGEILSFFIFGPQVTHYTDVYKTLGPKMVEASNRALVDVSALSPDMSKATLNGKSHHRVPYIYCSHGRSDLSDSCLTRDFGADSQERMAHFLEEWDTWYLTRAFPRGDLGVSNGSYAQRWYGRLYHRIKQWHDIFGLYNAFLPQFYTPQALQAFYADPLKGWGGNVWAIQNAFQYLIETILMPDVANYGKRTRGDGSVILAANAGQDLKLGVDRARYYSTNWSFSGQGGAGCGYFWHECLHHIGFYVDKVLAMQALMDSETNFVARANPIDIREWKVSYYNTFSASIRKIHAALQSGDWSRVGPYLDAKGQLRFPTYSGALTEVHANPVDPAADFTVQLYFALLGQAHFMTNFDRKFLDEAQIWIEGTAKAPSLPADATVSFVDPDSGLIYGALQRQGGAGAAMIGHANLLRARSNLCDGGALTATKADDCVPNLAVAARTAALADLRKYVQLLQAIAEMTVRMHYNHPLNP